MTVTPMPAAPGTPHTHGLVEAYCPHCDQQVPVERLRPEVGANVLLSLVSLGLWLPIWLWLYLASPRVCARCRQVLPR